MIRIDLNEPKILSKVTSDKFGRFVSNEWYRLLIPYTPRDTGMLVQDVGREPFKIHYRQQYSGYVYYSSGWEFKKKNPCATDHWDEKAAQAGQKAKLYRAINSALKNNKI